MDFWTCDLGDILHIPTVGWAVVKDGEPVIVAECLFSLFKDLEG